MLFNAQYLFTGGLLAAHHTEITTAVAALLVGIVVGITGMRGGALMTPALIFLGVSHVSSIVTADLTAAAIYKSGGAAVHRAARRAARRDRPFASGPARALSCDIEYTG